MTDVLTTINGAQRTIRFCAGGRKRDNRRWFLGSVSAWSHELDVHLFEKNYMRLEYRR